jgi:hypothetical protein
MQRGFCPSPKQAAQALSGLFHSCPLRKLLWELRPSSSCGGKIEANEMPAWFGSGAYSWCRDVGAAAVVFDGAVVQRRAACQYLSE